MTEVLEAPEALLEMRVRAQSIGRWPQLSQDCLVALLPAAKYPQGKTPLPGAFGFYRQAPEQLQTLAAAEKELVWLLLAALDGRQWSAIYLEAFRTSVAAVTDVGSAFMGLTGFDDFLFDAALAALISYGYLHQETVDCKTYLFPTNVLATAVASELIAS